MFFVHNFEHPRLILPNSTSQTLTGTRKFGQRQGRPRCGHPWGGGNGMLHVWYMYGIYIYVDMLLNMSCLEHLG